MKPRIVKINAVRMLLEFASDVDNSKGIKRIMDEEGNLNIPVERFGDFCHDIGLILGRVLERVAEAGE